MKYIAGAIGVVVIGILAYVFVSTSGSHPDGAQNVKNSDGTVETAGTFEGSLADLARRGGSWHCTFTSATAAATSKGNVYVNGEQIRGDFTTDTQGITIDSHMITQDGFIYTWSPIAPTGYKVPYSLDNSSGGAATNGQYQDFEQSYSYDCKPWSVDESKFVIPTDTTFAEVNGS